MLRPYQTECVNAVLESLEEVSSALYVMATGTGKTEVFCEIARPFLSQGRVLIVAHRLELVEQAAARIEKILGVKPEIEMGDRWIDEVSVFDKAPVVVTSVQSQISTSRGARRMSRFDPNGFSLIICDESHHSVSPSWKELLAYYRQNKEIKLVGCTATPDRADEEALGQIYEQVAYEYDLPDAVRDGWLVPIQQQIVHVKSLDFSTVRTTAGDLNGADLEAVMQFEENLHAVATPTLELAQEKKVVVFTVTVAHAERLCEIFNRHEPDCAVFVCGKTPEDKRREVFDRFKTGRARILCNVGVCTEGWDEPTTDCIVMARPTKSRSLYTQMIGRGTRALAGTLDALSTPEQRHAAIAESAKPHVLILDFVGNAGRHKLVHCTDILGGKYSDEALARAEKNLAKSQRPADVNEVLEQAKKEIAIEQARAEEIRRRHAIRAKAAYSTSSVSPFDVFAIEPAKERGWDAGKTLSEKQYLMLEKQGIEARALPYSQAKQLLVAQFDRWNKKLCSFKQAKWLTRNGYSPDLPRSEASSIMDAWAKNGWRRPAEIPNAVQEPPKPKVWNSPKNTESENSLLDLMGTAT